MIITDKWLIENSTEKGSWTYAQLEIIGVQTPPRMGWKSTVIGKNIDDDLAARFVEARNIRQRNGKATVVTDNDEPETAYEPSTGKITVRIGGVFMRLTVGQAAGLATGLNHDLDAAYEHYERRKKNAEQFNETGPVAGSRRAAGQ
jgi:hypothetical protein